MSNIITFPRGGSAPFIPQFDLEDYYEAIGVVREAARRVRFEAEDELLSDLEALEALIEAEDARDDADDRDDDEGDEALPHLLARLRRKLSGGSSYSVVGEAALAAERAGVEDEADAAPHRCDPADLARLHALLAMASRLERRSETSAPAEAAGPGRSEVAQDAAAEAALAAAFGADGEDGHEAESCEERAREEADGSEAAAAPQEASAAEQLAEAAAGAGREEVALISAISAGRLAIVFDLRRSAALAEQAEAAGCAPEDVVVTGLDWYLDALTAG